jgi:hypothetical protein
MRISGSGGCGIFDEPWPMAEVIGMIRMSKFVAGNV